MINPDSDDQNIPGLDDLLNSIRGESGGNKSGALAVYVPDEREENLVSEQIDERILALLGLEDVVDIDYATYKTLLKEKMVEGRMADSKMPSDEVELLTNEFKRVKGNTGRFKVQRQKINFQSFVDNVKPEETEEQSQPREALIALPGTAEVKQEPEVQPEEEEKEDKIQGIQKFLGDISDKLAKIEKNLGDMLDMEAEQAAIEKKEVDKKRVVGEKAKKRDRESKLEKSVKGFGKRVADKITKPITSLFDTILNFFKNIFLGNAIKGLIELLENPMMILNPLIDMVNGVIDVVNNVLEFVFGGIVDNINKMIGPLNGGLTNLENTVNSIFGMFGEQEEEDKIKLPRIPEAEVFQFEPIEKFKPKEEKKEESIKGMAGGGLVTNEILTSNTKQEVGGYKEGDQVTNLNFGNIGGSKSGDQVTNLNFGNIGGSKSGDMTISPKVSGFKGGGEIKPIYKFLSPITAYSGGGSVFNTNSNNSNTSNTNLGYTGGGSAINTSTSSSSPLNISNFGYNGGGSITSSSGQTITGMGPDTQLIAAQPGEIVMSNKAVQTYGANNLLAMNKDAGGTNVPTMGTIQGFSGGGVVQPVPSGSYKGQSGQKYGDPRSYGGHAGIDITEDPPYGNDPKVPVVSMADGKVVASSPNYPYQTSGYTSNLSVNHGNGLMATYLHMTPSKKVGTPVKRGERIGKLIPLGSASNNYAQTHLHLQTYKDGKVVNPLNVLSGSIRPGSGTDVAEVEPSPQEGAPAFKTNRRGRRIATVKPSSKSTPTISPPPQRGGQTAVLPVPGSNQQQPPTSAVSAGQKDVPSFSSRDIGNTEFIVIKSIYNMVG